MDNIEMFEEIGGRCDKTFICDICDESEVNYGGEGEESTWLKIYNVGDQDVCEYCLTSLIHKKPENVIEELESLIKESNS